MNREQRRQQKSMERKAASKPWPSMHGTVQQCGNCHYSCDPASHAAILERTNKMRLNAGTPAIIHSADETYCMYDTQDVAKKIWGWCRHWLKDGRMRVNGPVAPKVP